MVVNGLRHCAEDPDSNPGEGGRMADWAFLVIAPNNGLINPLTPFRKKKGKSMKIAREQLKIAEFFFEIDKSNR